MAKTLAELLTQTITITLVIMITSIRSQDFNPSVFVRCMNGFLGVTIRTLAPFNGIVYTDGHRDECFTVGTGLQDTLIQIPLTAIGSCGLNYDEATEQYYVLVHVREHSMIILQQDRTFNVSCTQVKSGEETQYDSYPKSVEMGLFDPDGTTKLHKTVFGNAYTIRVWSTSVDDDFMVTSCTGFAGHNFSLNLSDKNGCSINTDIMSNFIYSSSENRAVARLNSMFKFPNQNMIHLQCAVVFCSPTCRRTNCERRRDDPLLNSFGEFFKKKLTTPSSASQIQERFASTTVRVADFGNKTEFLKQTNCSYHERLLSALCILFACLFLAALCVNCIFCALAGYCCCTAEYLAQSQDGVQYVTKDLKAIGEHPNMT